MEEDDMKEDGMKEDGMKEDGMKEDGMEEDGMEEDNMEEEDMEEEDMEEENTEEDDTEDEDPENLFFKLRPRSCAVESIELRSSKLLQKHFDRLMRAAIPGKLETLIYEIGCDKALVSVDHGRIMRSLSPYHDTLECLELSHGLHHSTDPLMTPVFFTQCKYSPIPGVIILRPPSPTFLQNGVVFQSIRSSYRKTLSYF